MLVLSIALIRTEKSPGHEDSPEANSLNWAQRSAKARGNTTQRTASARSVSRGPPEGDGGGRHLFLLLLLAFCKRRGNCFIDEITGAMDELRWKQR